MAEIGNQWYSPNGNNLSVIEIETTVYIRGRAVDLSKCAAKHDGSALNHQYKEGFYLTSEGEIIQVVRENQNLEAYKLELGIITQQPEDPKGEGAKKNNGRNDNAHPQ